MVSLTVGTTDMEDWRVLPRYSVNSTKIVELLYSNYTSYPAYVDNM